MKTDDPFTVIASGASGILVGAVTLFVVFAAISAINMGQVPQVPFGMSRATRILYLFVSLGTFVGTFAVLRRDLAPPWRAFWVGIAIVWCGFWALCDVVSLPALFAW